MKTIKYFITSLFVLVVAFNATAQSHDSKMNMSQPLSRTESFKVWGQCDMCKSRIEKTVKSEGATGASWDIKSQLLTVTFDSAKTNREALSKKLAAAGHDTEKFKATDEVYAKLPECCHYERKK